MSLRFLHDLLLLCLLLNYINHIILNSSCNSLFWMLILCEFLPYGYVELGSLIFTPTPWSFKWIYNNLYTVFYRWTFRIFWGFLFFLLNTYINFLDFAKVFLKWVVAIYIPTRQAVNKSCFSSSSLPDLGMVMEALFSDLFGMEYSPIITLIFIFLITSVAVK